MKVYYDSAIFVPRRNGPLLRERPSVVTADLMKIALLRTGTKCRLQDKREGKRRRPDSCLALNPFSLSV